MFLYSASLIFRIIGERKSICGFRSIRQRLIAVPFRMYLYRHILPKSIIRLVRFASIFFILLLSSTIIAVHNASLIFLYSCRYCLSLLAIVSGAIKMVSILNPPHFTTSSFMLGIPSGGLMAPYGAIYTHSVASVALTSSIVLRVLPVPGSPKSAPTHSFLNLSILAC